MLLTLGLCLSVLGQNDLPGSNRSVGQARDEASLIVVAEVVKTDTILGIGSVSFATGIELKPTSVLKGKVGEGDLNSLSATAMGTERFPRVGDAGVFFINEFKGHLQIIKVIPKTLQNVKDATPAP